MALFGASLKQLKQPDPLAGYTPLVGVQPSYADATGLHAAQPGPQIGRFPALVPPGGVPMPPLRDTTEAHGRQVQGGMFGGSALDRAPRLPETGPPSINPGMSADLMNAPKLPGVDGDTPARPRFNIGEFLGNAGLALLATSNPQAASILLNLRQMRQNAQDNQDRFKLQHIEESRLADDAAWRRQYQSRPEYRTVNGQVISIPFGGGDPSVLYQAPEDFEIYADSLGLTPGTQEYQDAMRDFVLRSSGPTALDNRTAYENVRQGNRVTLEGIRQQNRTALTDARIRGRAAGERWFGNGGRGGGSGGASTRRTVVDRSGNRIEIEARGNRWYNVATGQPLQ